jgi:hypothetical protein
MSEKAPPSFAAVAVSSFLLGLLAGYFIGQGASIGVFGGSGGSQQAKKSWPNSYDVKVHADSSDDQADDEDEADDEADEDGNGKELKDFKDSNEEVKLVLAVRTDLGMGKGRQEVGSHSRALLILSSRQGCSSMLSRDPGLLQVSPQPRHVSSASQAMGVGWTAQDCGAS